MEKKSYRGHIAMLSANVMWGCMAPVSKAVLQSGINPFALTTFRMLGAAVAFWVASLFGPKENVPPKDLALLFFAALFGIVFNQGSFIIGVSLTSPIDASIVTTTTPIITMIIAAFYLKEPVTGKKITGVFIGALGALLLILSSGQTSSSNGNSIAGDLLCLLAQISFSVYFVLFKDLISRYSPITIMKWMFMYASVCCIPFSYHQITAIEFTLLPVSVFWGIGFVVLGATFIPYLLIPIGQRLLRPTVACMYNYVQPLVASVLAVLWGMDSFGPVKIIAVILVFSGVYIVTQSKSRADMEAEQS